MKKIIALILAIVMCLSLSACIVCEELGENNAEGGTSGIIQSNTTSNTPAIHQTIPQAILRAILQAPIPVAITVEARRIQSRKNQSQTRIWRGTLTLTMTNGVMIVASRLLRRLIFMPSTICTASLPRRVASSVLRGLARI